MNYYTLDIGKESYKLVLSTRAMVELEKKLGCNPIDILVATQENHLPKVNDMVAILWASLIKYQHGIKFEDCYDIFDGYIEDGHNMLEFLQVIVEIFRVSGIFNENESPNVIKEGK